MTSCGAVRGTVGGRRTDGLGGHRAATPLRLLLGSIAAATLTPPGGPRRRQGRRRLAGHSATGTECPPIGVRVDDVGYERCSRDASGKLLAGRGIIDGWGGDTWA